MPTYLRSYEVDWGWSELSPIEREIAMRYHKLIESDPNSVSWPWLIEQLTRAAVELWDRAICVCGAEPADDEDDEEVVRFVVFEKGTHREGTEEDFGGDVVTEPVQYSSTSSDKIAVALYLEDSMWKEIQKYAYEQDRSWSWMVQKAWKIARSEIQASPIPEK